MPIKTNLIRVLVIFFTDRLYKPFIVFAKTIITGKIYRIFMNSNLCDGNLALRKASSLPMPSGFGYLYRIYHMYFVSFILVSYLLVNISELKNSKFTTLL